MAAHDRDAEQARVQLKNPGYEIFMGLLSVLSIVNIVLYLLIKDEAMRDVIDLMSVVLTFAFASDFTYRIITAPDRKRYFLHEFGWADMLASIPLPQTNVLRLFRLIKVYRLLQEYGARNILRSLWRDLAGSALLMLLFAGIIMLEFGSLLLLDLEADVPAANITTASDALWYVIVTMATVGYGDQYPITNPGRLVGTVIIVVGVGIFGTLTGYLANLFLATRPGTIEGPQDVQAHLTALRSLVAQQQAAIDELERLVADGGSGPAASEPDSPPDR